jgi:hypothetical protein
MEALEGRYVSHYGTRAAHTILLLQSSRISWLKQEPYAGGAPHYLCSTGVVKMMQRKLEESLVQPQLPPISLRMFCYATRVEPINTTVQDFMYTGVRCLMSLSAKGC